MTILTAGLLAALSLTACGEKAAAPSVETPAPSGSLQPVDGARDVKKVREVGVTYVVNACYPAADLITRIGERIPKGWTPRDPDPTDEGGPWRTYVKTEGETQPVVVHHWHRAWESPEGDGLRYDIRYTSPVPPGAPTDNGEEGGIAPKLGPPSNCDAQVRGAFLSRDAAAKFVEESKKK